MAKQMIAEGRLGRINHVSIRLLADYAAHPEGALTWRFKTEWSGSGVLGDLASHGVDLGRYLVGDITDLMCDAATFIAQRPQVGMTASHFSRGAGGPMGADENEDYDRCTTAFSRRRSRNTGVQPSPCWQAVKLWHRSARRSRCAVLGLQADGQVAAVP
jgi:predicted dehydrogenase